ncbi:NAD(P)-binding protein [Exidia glandulosa HHB12029]|uniref:NAD(P)-binding protein n=1 Tax=Exidia glandulosa HHB12029 TaxID=1314781 RepID=A0A165Z7V8_EXIGL|nr:NAD(P)-binding protein [Exidia glandulosa HHB12029]
MTIVQDTTAPLVVVVGATGIQGGSVIRTLAASDKPYRIRGLTRDASKPAAKSLVQEGIEVHTVNLVVENASAVKAAFQGADIAFLVTNFWEHLDMAREVAEGKLLVDAAVEGGAKRVIWSGLESFSDATNGRLTHVDHFEGKADITKYAKAKLAGTGVAFNLVDAGLYMSNMVNPGAMVGPRAKGDGTYVIALPCAKETKLPWIDMAADYGSFVRLAIEDAEYARGGDIFTSSEELSWTEIVNQLSEVTGKTVVFESVEPEAYKERLVALGTSERLALEFRDNFVGFGEVGYYAGRQSTAYDKLAKKPRAWKDFVVAHDWSSIFV